MKTVTLESKELIILAVNKKTTAKMFKDIKVGDKLKCSVKFNSLGTSRGRTYAPMIFIDNLSNGGSAELSFNEASRYMGLFDYEEV